jgi:DNA-binding protein HU-beta
VTHKDFTTELSRKLGYSAQDTSKLIASLTSELTNRLQTDGIASITNFGTFEVRKKAERIMVSPATKQRMLVPPKLVLTFRPSASLKEEFK